MFEKYPLSLRFDIKKMLLGVLLVLLGAVSFYLVHRYVIKETLIGAEFPLLDPTATLDKNQDELVRFQPLREAIQTQYENHPDFYVGLYFEYLPTGASISVNKDRAMWPASLIKIPVAMAVMKKIERGEWKLSNELVILDEDKDPSFGDLYLKPTGTKVTIEDLLKNTLIQSDNTAHYILLRNLDNEELEDVFVHLGLDEVLVNLQKSPDIQVEDNRMTAKTYSVFFRSLFNATYLSPEFSELFLKFLTEGVDEYSSIGIPDTVIIAHKTGIREEDGVWADSGIVYENRRPYILTIMLEKKRQDYVAGPEEVQALFSEISSQIYTYVSTLE